MRRKLSTKETHRHNEVERMVDIEFDDIWTDKQVVDIGFHGIRGDIEDP